MRWSDIVSRNKADENKSSICGFFLNCLGVDLENLPASMMGPCRLYNTEGKQYTKARIQRVNVDSIVGTRYEEYAGETWLDVLLRLRRSDRYIKNDIVLRGKYFKMLKQDYFDYPPVCLSRDKRGQLYIDGNGNHRVTFYKMMRFTDNIMERAIVKQQFHVNQSRKQHSLYWLYANVKDEV